MSRWLELARRAENREAEDRPQNRAPGRTGETGKTEKTSENPVFPVLSVFPEPLFSEASPADTADEAPPTTDERDQASELALRSDDAIAAHADHLAALSRPDLREWKQLYRERVMARIAEIGGLLAPHAALGDVVSAIIDASPDIHAETRAPQQRRALAFDLILRPDARWSN